MQIASLLGRSLDRDVTVGIVGAGEFGRTFISQARRVPGLAARLACDRDVERAVGCFVSNGIAREDVVVCAGRAEALRALESGKHVVVEDAATLAGLPLDIVVEATGDPESAAAVAEKALDNGKHVAMVTKEAESVVGPLLARKAAAAGLVHTPVDGDQPSLLIGLLSWTGLLGLEIVAAGKASEYDFVLDPAGRTLTSQGRTIELADPDSLWNAGDRTPKQLAQARAAALAGFWHRTVPDLCELTIVANATGLAPDAPALHAPVARTVELPDLLALESAGGLLREEGTLDIFNCLRRPDELSFAGGVFVVARTPDARTGRLFKEKGLPVSADDDRVLIHNPVHLLGAEAPLSVLSACRAGKSTAGDDVRPRTDLVGRTSKAIPAGTALEIGWRHTIDGVDAEMVPARAVGTGAVLPYYLLPGSVTRTDIPAGTSVKLDMVQPPEQSVLWRLRREQDALFQVAGEATSAAATA